jgi:hypothetical protein
MDGDLARSLIILCLFNSLKDFLHARSLSEDCAAKGARICARARAWRAVIILTGSLESRVASKSVPCDAWRTAGSLNQSVGTVSKNFPFDDAPQTCFEAVGDYEIGRTGIIFSFLTGFPGYLNRFVIERADLDANRSRLYFIRGGRFELTVSQSVLRDGQWVSLPLAPSPLPKG